MISRRQDPLAANQNSMSSGWLSHKPVGRAHIAHEFSLVSAHSHLSTCIVWIYTFVHINLVFCRV